MTGTIVCFSGKIGSGKSSVSKAVAQSLGCNRAGFGDYLRKLIVLAGGNPESRRELQDLGQALVQNDHSSFCEGLLSDVEYQIGADLVIDGIRHVKIYDELATTLLPARVILIHLDIGEDLRKLRAEMRGDDPSELVTATLHPVEQDTMTALSKRASAIVDAGEDLAVVVQSCLAEIQKLN